MPLYPIPALPFGEVAPRPVEIWLPPGYNPARRYPVIYMHDGQNLFEPEKAFIGIDWGIDEALTALMENHGYAGALVVGVWNSGPTRWNDYMPQKPLSLPAVRAVADQYADRFSGPALADAYLRFLVQTLKPWVDAHYATHPGRAHTAVMGSSMGGLISLYALTEYPDVFGAAGCVSTHWPAGGEALVDYFGRALPAPGAHRLYFDFGTADLDALYEPFQQRMDAHLLAAGYTPGRDWVTRKFPGAGHSETAWRARAADILQFVLGA